MITMGALTAKRTFFDSVEVKGVTKVSSPAISFKTTTVQMAGGEAELPSALLDSMEATVSFTSGQKETARLYDTGTHALEQRYVQEEFSNGSSVRDVLVKEFMDVVVKKMEKGDSELGGQNESTATYEVLRYRLIEDGLETVLVDKRTGKIVLNGKDRSSQRLNLLK